MRKGLLLIVLLLAALCRPATAQFPEELMPVSKQELADTGAAKVDTTTFKAYRARGDSIWTVVGGGAVLGSEVSTASRIEFLIRMPVGPADSGLTDTRHLVQARHLWASLDSLECVWGEAGDTTSPGLFYYLASDNKWYRAGATVEIKAQACAVDSVNKGAQCRFQHRGLFVDSRYQGLWGPGTRLVNDSLTAGQISPLDTLRSDSLKMHNLATMIDSATGKILIDIAPGFWYKRN